MLGESLDQPRCNHLEPLIGQSHSSEPTVAYLATSLLLRYLPVLVTPLGNSESRCNYTLAYKVNAQEQETQFQAIHLNPQCGSFERGSRARP